MRSDALRRVKWDGTPFGGAKLAALHGDALLAYRRDDLASLPFPGMIDLPGGGRQGDEGPAECVLRELAVEFGISLPVDRLHYHRSYRLGDDATTSHFFAAYLTPAEAAAVQFGDEGQDWALMPTTDFIASADAIPRLREWLGHYRTADKTIRYLDTARKNPGKA
jgi:8-oxo-dGTP diphosphatase